MRRGALLAHGKGEASECPTRHGDRATRSKSRHYGCPPCRNEKGWRTWEQKRTRRLFAGSCTSCLLKAASAVKSMVTAMNAVLKGQRFEDEELVAEGDVVTARFNQIFTLPDGSTVYGYTLPNSRDVHRATLTTSLSSRGSLRNDVGTHRAELFWLC